MGAIDTISAKYRPSPQIWSRQTQEPSASNLAAPTSGASVTTGRFHGPAARPDQSQMSDLLQQLGGHLRNLSSAASNTAGEAASKSLVTGSALSTQGVSKPEVKKQMSAQSANTSVAKAACSSGGFAIGGNRAPVSADTPVTDGRVVASTSAASATAARSAWKVDQEKLRSAREQEE